MASTKRSFLLLYRIITNNVIRKTPKWVCGNNIRELIPIMLVGGWNARYNGDKEIIEIFSNINYNEYVNKLNKWITIEDAPVLNILDNFQIISVQDTWNFLFQELTYGDIENLKICINKIFGVTDPAFDLPKDDWFMASVFGKTPNYSTTLQHGIIISLIMLTERDSEENNFGILSTCDYVNTLIKNHLSQISTWKQWNTITPSLPLLVEASPRAILERIEAEIKNNNEEFWSIFESCDDVLLGRNYYMYILWTLEKLVWYKSYVVRAIMVLAEICEKNINYRMVNSPSDTLYKIFCLWNPQCSLNYMERISIIKKICDNFSMTGQVLINSLLPSDSGSISTPIQKPQWSIFEDNYLSPISVSDYYKAVDDIVNLSLEVLTINVGGWKVIFQHISEYQYVFEKLEKKCMDYCNLLSEQDLLEILNPLRDQIYHFRKFIDAKSNMSEEYISKLEHLLHNIEPNSIMKYQYLYKRHAPILNPLPCSKDIPFNIAAVQDLLREIRLATTNMIVDSYDIETIFSFCTTIEEISEFGEVILNKVLNSSYDFNLLNKFKNLNYSLYSCLLWKLYLINGIDILIETLIQAKDMSDPEKGDILCHTPLSSEIWSKLCIFNTNIIKYYWEHKNALRLDKNDEGYTDYYLKKLLEYKRPFSALRIIEYTDYNNTDMVIRILENCIQLQDHQELSGLSLSQIQKHDILNLLSKIYKNQNIDELLVARLEIIYLPYFDADGSVKPKAIINCFHKNPKEYVILISKCYKPDKISLTKNRDEVAFQRAYNILEHFNTIPGCNEIEISKEIFNTWVSEPQTYAHELGFKKAFEICLGKLLCNSPAGTDNIYPHEIIRDFIEKNDSSEFIHSFIIGKVNKRGAYFLSGGKNEINIADSYFNNAKSVRVIYPKTASLLEQLGNFYKRESYFDQKRELLDFLE